MNINCIDYVGFIEWTCTYFADQMLIIEVFKENFYFFEMICWQDDQPLCWNSIFDPFFLFQKRRFIWNLGWENWYCLKSQDNIAVMITKVIPLRMQSFNNMHVPVGNIILKINFQIHMNNGFLIYFLMQFFGIISSSLHSS